MRTSDSFKKRRAPREKRKYAFKTPKANSYLIVTEGTSTEPNYFNGLKKKVEQHVGGNLAVVAAPNVKVHGCGRATENLILEAEKQVSKARIIYQNVWVIFDKDDFPDFDCAVELGRKKGYHVGWSNQSFEYWLFLHFEYSEAYLHRDDWVKKLDGLFRTRGLRSDGYHKNIENIYELLDSFGGVRVAIENAKRRMSTFGQKRRKPSDYAPGTTVYLLVDELVNYLAP